MLPAPIVIALALLFSAGAFYLATMLIKGIAELSPDLGSFPRRRPLLATCLIMAALIGSMSLARLADPFWVLSFAGSIPLAVVQSWLNDYWRSVEPPELSVRQAFTGKELIAILFGSLLLGLVMVHLVMGTR